MSASDDEPGLPSPLPAAEPVAVVATKPMPRVFGVDEAGRGPIIGPMAIAVVALDKGASAALRRCGVADSKSFGAGPDACAQRTELADKIRRKTSLWRVQLVDVEEIDHYTWRGQLNALERRIACELLRELGVGQQEKIVCDGALLFSPLRALFPALRAVDHGESAHVAVAAASILAKVARDDAFAVIAARYESEFGPVTGGGYCNAATRRFLDAYRERKGGLPPEARKSWGAPKDETLPLFADVKDSAKE
jgi:ribonuclease HII